MTGEEGEFLRSVYTLQSHSSHQASSTRVAVRCEHNAIAIVTITGVIVSLAFPFAAANAPFRSLLIRSAQKKLLNLSCSTFIPLTVSLVSASMPPLPPPPPLSRLFKLTR